MLDNEKKPQLLFKFNNSCKLYFFYNLYIVSAISGAILRIVNLLSITHLSWSLIGIVSVKNILSIYEIPKVNEAFPDKIGWVAYAMI